MVELWVAILIIIFLFDLGKREKEKEKIIFKWVRDRVLRMTQLCVNNTLAKVTIMTKFD